MSLNEFAVMWRGILKRGCRRDLWGPSMMGPNSHPKNDFEHIRSRNPTVFLCAGPKTTTLGHNYINKSFYTR